MSNESNKSIFIIIIAIIFIFIIFFMNRPTSFKAWKIINKNIKPNVNVFIGDSITHGADFKDYFDDLIVLNKGISGDVTDGIIKRLDDDIFSFNPSKVFILIGINDIGSNIDNEKIIKNINTIIKEIQNNCPNTKIYLESIYPINNTNNKKINKKYFKYRNNKDVVDINNKLVELAKNDNVIYIDIYSHLIDDKGNLKLSLTYEGLHLNKDGYKVVFKVLKPYVYN